MSEFLADRFVSSTHLAALCLMGLACVSSSRAAEPVPADHAERVKAGTKLFKEQVRTVLVQQCLECHGGKSVKGDFDLSTRDKLLSSGYVEAQAADSYLIDLIEHRAEPHMPFKAPKLPAAAIASIRKWIDLGAPYDAPLVDGQAPLGPMLITEEDRQFWSFRPLMEIAPPEVRAINWCRTEIDRFILARQEAQGLHPNAPADRRTLIRRVYLDLLGLPPTFEEVEAFVSDKTSNAYEHLLDRILASPHYGERWARHWMDIARFAESHGYEQDYDRPHAYHYRDFLIRAFNDDLPFDEFVRWQLAGDELAPENPEALKATGFLGAGVFPTQLTEQEFESARYDELDDMIATTGVSFLGLSIGCARCHDHKFDAIPTRDYYELISNFSRTIRSEIELDLSHEANAIARVQHQQQLQALRQQLATLPQAALPDFNAWLSSEESVLQSGPWEMLQVTSVTSTGGSTLSPQADGSWLAQGVAPPQEVITIRGRADRANIAALRLETLTDDSLPHRGPGRAANGNFALGNLVVAIEGPAPAQVSLTTARATHQQNVSSLSVQASLDADPVSGWAVDAGGIGKDQAAVFDLSEPITLGKEAEIVVTLTFNHPNRQHAAGRIRLSVSDRTNPAAEVGISGPPQKIVSAIEQLRTAPASERTPQHPAWKVALDWYLNTRTRQPQLKSELATLEATGPKLSLTKVMVTSEGLPHMSHHADGRGYPHFYPETFYLTRGDVHQKGDIAPPGYLQVLMRNGKTAEHWRVQPPAGWTRTTFQRASLAHWMTDVDDGAGHLLARVIVNRLWQHHFGRGIVATPNDFGVPGEQPTHPELLDWLARDLVTHGWKLKRLHKLMLLSNTYRQDTKWDEARASIDRENQLFWRRVPQRLEAEAIRDSMLQVSGLLDPTMYGPGTLDQKMTRRSVYFFLKRSQLIPMMMLFDWPEHLVSIGQRSSTTIAPQALMFMNSPQGRRYAEALATASQAEADDSQAAIQHTYQRIFSRNPQPAELELAMSFLARQEQIYREQTQQHPRQWALTDLCQALLSSSEFCYVD